MSKELEALETIKDYAYVDDWDNLRLLKEEHKEELEIIENALKENEALKSQIAGLENAYDKLANKCEKYYKALEIIKETRVDTNFIKLSKNYDDYCGMEVMKILNHIETAEQKGITQKEYDLLKEVLL